MTAVSPWVRGQRECGQTFCWDGGRGCWRLGCRGHGRSEQTLSFGGLALDGAFGSPVGTIGWSAPIEALSQVDDLNAAMGADADLTALVAKGQALSLMSMLAGCWPSLAVRSPAALRSAHTSVPFGRRLCRASGAQREHGLHRPQASTPR